jgi:cysteine desulfurase
MAVIYLDNNASTPLLPAVWEAMRPHALEAAGNPASSHQAGRRARQALEDAREHVAALLDARPDEVVFTSGATEANNLAILGLAGDGPGHLVSSPIEHPCVREPLRQLTKAGFTLDLLPVDGSGVVRTAELPALLQPATRLVCVMLANHETGGLQPVRDVAAACPEGVAVHCDAAAAAGKVPVRFHALGVTSLTLSAHKFHGPQGVGALLVRRGAALRPLLWGGHQQRARRPGTEAVALAVGLAAALDLAERQRDERLQQVRQLRQLFHERLWAEAAPVVTNGPEEAGVPHTLNLSFPGCRAEVLLMNLDLAGVACSAGSACSSGSLLPSPVLEAMAVPREVLHSAVRFSFSHLLTEAEILEAARRVAAVVSRLRGGDGASDPSRARSGAE